jgi:DNA-directed RNA polymerase specialized sigma24 family protein
MLETSPQVPSTSDDEIVLLLREKAPEGLRLLLAKHGPRIRAILRADFRGSLSEMEVEEAINVATYRVWRGSNGYNPKRGTLRAWFHVICRNAALTVLQREKRHRGAVIELDGLEVTDHHAKTQPVRPTDGQLGFVSVLRSCIHDLPPMQRAIQDADLESDDVADAEALARRFRTSKNSI